MSSPPLTRLGQWLEAVPGVVREHYDVAVVLGGHPRVRVPGAVDLWKAGTVRQVCVVGGQLVNGRPAEVRRGERWAHALGVPDDQLVRLETEALGTVEEAHVVRAAAVRRGWNHILVVTSPYHCRRSWLIFQQVFATTTARVDVAPTTHDDWSTGGWHTDPRLRWLVGRELAKFVMWRTGLRRLVRPGR